MYPHRDLDALDTSLTERAEGRRALVVTDTVFSMDGDVADVDGARSSSAPRHGALLVLDEAHAVLGPELTDARTRRCCGSARCRRRSARSVASSPAPRRLTELVVNRARSYIFTTASTSRPTPPPRSPRSRSSAAREGDELRARLRRNVDAAPPRPPVADRPRACAATRHARSPLAAGPARARPARPRDPAADGAGRHRRACGSRSRPRTRSSRSRALRARSRASASRDTVLVTGTGTEVGKTWWGRATSTRCATTGVAVAARKPAQSYAPDELGATDAELLARASGEPAETVCPPPPLVRGADGAADGGRRARPAAVHDRRPRRGARAVAAGRARSRSSRVRAGPARRSPPTATP